MTATPVRNVDFDPSLPVDEWPGEAIEAVIDRGTLSDWKRVAAAVRANPWGPAARTVETVAGWGEHYGVDALMLDAVRTAREVYDAQARRRYAGKIRAWRRRSGMTLRQFAALAGTSASRISDYENAKVAPTTDILGRLEQVARQHRRPGSTGGLGGQ